MKISIVGASNSGKSSLARKISQTYNIPYLQIDRLWFDAGGHNLFLSKSKDLKAKTLVQDRITSAISDFLEQNSDWVCDGTYEASQPLIAKQADDIVLITRPLLKRMWSNIIRVLTNDHRHPEVTRAQDLKFTLHIAKRHRNNEQKNIEDLIKPFSQKVTRLHSFKEIDNYFDKLKI